MKACAWILKRNDSKSDTKIFFSLLSFAVIICHYKMQLVEERVCLASTSLSQSITKQCQGRNLEARNGAEVKEKCWLLAYLSWPVQPSFFIAP